LKSIAFTIQNDALPPYLWLENLCGQREIDTIIIITQLILVTKFNIQTKQK